MKQVHCDECREDMNEIGDLQQHRRCIWPVSIIASSEIYDISVEVCLFLLFLFMVFFNDYLLYILKTVNTEGKFDLSSELKVLKSRFQAQMFFFFFFCSQ